MPKIKLKEWADKHGLHYITANRHFHAGLIPNAVQLDSGTILVEDDSLEQSMASNSSNDAMSLFLKKTVEFSKNNSSVEDFAAYVISNFQLKLNSTIDSPRYSKNKPKPEEVQKHFQQFLPDKEKEEQLKAIKSMIKEQNKGKESSVEEPNPFTRLVETGEGELSEQIDFELINEIMSAPEGSDVPVYGPTTTTDGLVTRSVDLNTTPQQINYTGSTSQAISGSSSSLSFGGGSMTFGGDATMNCSYDMATSGDLGGTFNAITIGSMLNDSSVVSVQPTGVYLNAMAEAPVAAAFMPTKKELQSAAKVIEQAAEQLPRKRGRKPTFNKR